MALENKESIEILKGLAGLQSGMLAPGGLVNYVTKRPAAFRAGLPIVGWVKPVTITSVNINLCLDLEFALDWRASLAASRSCVVIDDKLAFSYGYGYDMNCGGSGTPPRYFSANGDFDIYDYRFPDDTRRNNQLQAILPFYLATGKIRHDLPFGESMFRRTVSQSDGVNVAVGSDNIDNPNLIVYETSSDTPGASYLRLDSPQKVLFAVDRISLTPQWQLIAGVRHVWVNEHALDNTGAVTCTTEKTLLLSTISRQIEAGIKYDWRDRLSLSVAMFQMSKPYEYPKPSVNGFTYTQQGTETHKGAELSAAGQVSKQLKLTASVVFIQAQANDMGTPAYDGHQLINVPRLRTALYTAYALPDIAGLTLLGGWQYSASKMAIHEGDVSVRAYLLFNAGLRCKTNSSGHPTIIRLRVDNLFDKCYWRDAGEYIGDGYPLPHWGAAYYALVAAVRLLILIGVQV